MADQPMPDTPPAAPVAPPPRVSPQTAVALAQLGALVAQLAADPQARPEVLRLVRRAVPSMPIPELDLADRLEQQLSERTQPVTEEIAKLRDQLTTLQTAITRRSWAEQKGLTEEELKQVEELAKERKLPDAETAYELWEARRAKLGTPRATPSPMEGLTKDDWRELSRRPARWAQDMALRDLAEARRTRRAG